jgi:hypothetical protein
LKHVAVPGEAAWAGTRAPETAANTAAVLVDVMRIPGLRPVGAGPFIEEGDHVRFVTSTEPVADCRLM